MRSLNKVGTRTAISFSPKNSPLMKENIVTINLLHNSVSTFGREMRNKNLKSCSVLESPQLWLE